MLVMARYLKFVWYLHLTDTKDGNLGIAALGRAAGTKKRTEGTRMSAGIKECQRLQRRSIGLKQLISKG